MTRFLLLLTATTLACLLPFPTQAATVKSIPLTLVYSNDVHGELEPCG